MSKKKVDFTGVQAFTMCEEGEHVAKLTKLEDKEAQSGNDMYAATFEVQRGNSKGARVYTNFVLIDTALWKFKQFLESVGIKADGKVLIDTDKLVGKVCIIGVSEDESSDKPRMNIDYFKGLNAPKSEDTDDEDEDDEDDEDEKPAKKAKDKKPAKKPEPEEDEDDEDEEEEKPKAKKKTRAERRAEKKAQEAKAKKKPAKDEDDDEDDDDEDEPPAKKKGGKKEEKKPAKKPAKDEDDDDDDDDDDWEDE